MNSLLQTTQKSCRAYLARAMKEVFAKSVT